jgi:putative transcriptional regulator
MNAMEVLRRNVVFKRAEHGYSQAVLASRASVTRQTISKIESGHGTVTVQILEKIAKVLGCGIDELFAPRCLRADDAELERRANSPQSDFVDARTLLGAIDEANEVRYSRAGRPKTMDRKAS